MIRCPLELRHIFDMTTHLTKLPSYRIIFASAITHMYPKVKFMPSTKNKQIPSNNNQLVFIKTVLYEKTYE